MEKILIVDDEPALRQTLGAILKRAGYTPFLAGNGKECMQLLDKDTYSLVFLDIKLPDVMGVDLLPDIHKVDPNLPVIILTAHATLEAAMQAVRGGARDFMLKPIEPEAILNRVRSILEENREPLRHRQIISRVQDLLAELNTPDNTLVQAESSQTPAASLDDERFVRRGAFTADLHTGHVILNGEPLSIPPSSFEYLVTLLRHSPDSVSFEDLVKESQGYECTRLEARDITRWHIHKIRKVIEKDTADPQHLITVRDFGYRLVG